MNTTDRSCLEKFFGVLARVNHMHPTKKSSKSFQLFELREKAQLQKARQAWQTSSPILWMDRNYGMVTQW